MDLRILDLLNHHVIILPALGNKPPIAKCDKCGEEFIIQLDKRFMKLLGNFNHSCQVSFLKT